MNARISIGIIGTLLLAGSTALADRNDRGNRSDNQQDSRPAARPAAPREAPSWQRSAPEPRREAPAQSPRFQPAPRVVAPDRGPAVRDPSPSWRPTPAAPPSYQPPRAIDRSGRVVVDPLPARPVDRTPARITPGGWVDNRNGGSRPGNDTPRRSDIGDGVGATRPGGGSARQFPSRDTGDRGSGGSAPGSFQPRGNDVPVDANRPGRGSSRPSILRPGVEAPVGASRPGGGSARRVIPSDNGTSSPIGWRPPSRVPGTTRAGVNDRVPGSRNPSGSAPVGPGGFARGPVGTRTPVVYTPSHRPPVVSRGRWTDNGRYHYDLSGFHTISVGWWDPCYRYPWAGFRDPYFYYPYYYNGPWMSGFYYSPFWIYGSWFPTYVYPERVIYIERRVYLRDAVSDDNTYDYYSSSTSSLRDTMDDIQSAWLDGDGGLLLQHINSAIPVRVYQKGTYKYSLEPDDYRDITKDALNRISTTDFEWTNVDKVISDEVHAEAKHTFRDPDGDKHIVRLTYTLEKARGSWWITETGTAPWYDEL